MDLEPLYNWEKEDVDLTLGTNHLINSLQERYPNLPATEIEVLGNALLGKIGDSLSAGDQLASLRPTPDGQVNIHIWHFGPIKEG